ncbi:MAG: OmpH family outer membrane protein [Bacteroidales bacterium]|nr:OmpH family outer membrane protein [Bacteroidales bacterium]
MKKIILFVTVFIFSIGLAFSQKFAFVDSEYILSHIPAYKSAQDQLDNISSEWQKEIEQKYQEIDQLYKNYQSEKVLLSEEMKRKKEDEIISKEKAVKDLQKKYFGPEGDLYKKRQELVKPIQDEIYNAVKEISAEGNYAVIFDTAEGLSILYFNPKYDISDEVLIKLGYKN